MHKKLPKLVVVLGPTASGKSCLAVDLIKQYNGEIISADSRQIYQEIDIGTAKDVDLLKQGMPVHMVDVVPPDKTLTVAQYKKQALHCINKIISKNKHPFLVGGTGLYIQSIVDNLKIPQVKPNQALRARLEKKSVNELFAQLKRLAPEKANELNQSDKQNKRRLVRVLEIAFSGKSFGSKAKPLFNCLQIGLKIPLKKLDQRINKRVDQMIKQGLQDEVEKLAQNYDWDLSSMSGIGYSEWKEFFAGKQTLQKTIYLIKLHTRQYARSQLKWFKRDKRIVWVKHKKQATKLVKDFLV